MSTNVGSIFVEASVDDNKFNTSLKSMESKAKSSANESEKALTGIEADVDISKFKTSMSEMVSVAKDSAKQVTDTLGNMSKGVGIGLAGLGAGAFAAASGVAELVTEVGKLNSTGLGTEQLMGAIKAMQQYGFTAEETADHLKTISESAFGNSQAWEENGVAVKDASGEYLSLDKILKNLITVMQTLSPEQQKMLAETLSLGEAAGWLSKFMSDLSGNLETYNSVTGESVESMEELKTSVQTFNEKLGEMKIQLLKSIASFLGFIKTHKETIKTVLKLTIAMAALWLVIGFTKAISGAIMFLGKMAKSMVLLGFTVAKNIVKFVVWSATVIFTASKAAAKFLVSSAKMIFSFILTGKASEKQTKELKDDEKETSKTNDKKTKSFLESAKKQIASIALVKKGSDKQDEELEDNEKSIDKTNEELAKSFGDMAKESIEELNKLMASMKLAEQASDSMERAMRDNLKGMEQDFDKYINKMIAKVGALGAALVAVGLLPGGTAALKGADKIAERGGDVAGSGVFNGVDIGKGVGSNMFSNSTNTSTSNTTNQTFNINANNVMSYNEAYRQSNLAMRRGRI